VEEVKIYSDRPVVTSDTSIERYRKKDCIPRPYIIGLGKEE